LLANLSFAFGAVMPLVLLMALGYLLRRLKILTESFCALGNKLVFHVMLPCTLFMNIYAVGGLSDIRWPVIVFSAVSVLVLYAIARFTTRVFVREPESRGAAAQAVFRSNTALIGLPLATSLGGAEAAALCSVTLAFVVPLFNLLSVVLLTNENPENGKQSFWAMAGKVIKNPLILGALAGLLCLFVRSFIPLRADGARVFSIQKNLPSLWSAIKSVGGMATPFALITLGGLFDFSVIGGKLRNIVFGCFWRLIGAPLVVVGGGVLLTRLGVLDFGPIVYCVLLPVFASPIAVSSAPMVDEMGGDSALARQYVVWTSVLFILTLPAEIMLLRSIGMI